MKRTQVLCDVCDTHGTETPASHVDTPMQVIFTTEQTEGRSSPPYLDNVKIDLCDSCMKIVLEGKYIFAEGAQGSNTYSFR